MANKERDKHILISADLHSRFERVATSYGLSNKALLEQMIIYFEVTKADPRDPKAGNPTDAIKALDKRLIGFIREQEKKILIPILDELRVSTKQLEQIKINETENIKQLKQSQIRVLGGAIKPDLLNPNFLEAYKNMGK